MEDNMDNTGAVNSDNQPSVQTIRINNREVAITDAPEVLAQMEHDLKSGYNRKLEDERARTASNLRADTQWYSTHDPAEWGSYEPLVDGGRGWVGSGEPKLAGQGPASQTSQSAQPVQNKPDPFAENQLLQLRVAQQQTQAELTKIQVERALSTLDGIAPKYPDADLKAVKLRMQVHHEQNGKPASAGDIETFLRESHEHTNKRVNAVRKGIEAAGRSSGQAGSTGSALPDASGGSGSGSTKPKTLNLATNLEELIRRTADKMGGRS